MSANQTNYTDQPVYWFVILEQALDRGDLEQAAQAQRELARLGVRVNHDRRRPKRQEAATR